MAFINQVLVEGAQVFARQAVTTAVSVIGANLTPSMSIQTVPLSTTTTPTPSPTDTSVSNGSPGSSPGSNNNSQPQTQGSSPLLFFVALGFGVVFTNLWIIVGVKYCFRYNARNRQMRLDADGEPINLENMPRPHRRRREKKLMTMDEVNEKFPMQKYKNWVASRAQEGLPTRGGVSVHQSRANSVREAEGAVPELTSKDRESAEYRPTTSATSNVMQENLEKGETQQQPGHEAKGSMSSTVGGLARMPSNKQQDPAIVSESQPFPKVRESQDDEEEDDEHINSALPPECMGTSGDTCAICIDMLEDDDDVRGLTCGHAFHAVCLDPWLTSRRACCPLCKADYYTPKPRTQAAGPGDGTTGVIAVALVGDPRNRMNMPSRPQRTWIGISGLPTRFAVRQAVRGVEVHHPQQHVRRGGRRFGFLERFRQQAGTPPATASPMAQTSSNQAPSQSRFQTFTAAFPAFRMARRGVAQPPPAGGPAVSGANDEVITPSNLEAGVRP